MKYGFLGCGNMGGAIARALSKKCRDFLITDRSGKAKALADQLGCTYSDRDTIVNTCDAIFIGVKPHMVKELLAPYQEVLQERKPLIISMAAGVEIAPLEQMCGGRLPVLRIMPNTPVAVGRVSSYLVSMPHL